MSGRVKIKIKDKKPKIDVFKVIENRFKNMNELRDLIDMDPRKGLVRIRDGAGFREVVRDGPALGRWCGTDHLPEIDPAGLPFLGSPPPNPQKSKIGTATINEPKKECLFCI